MKLLVTGGKGMLGRTIQRELREFEVIPADLPEADITDAAGFEKLVKTIHPDVVIHCAAMTAVDKCESEAEAAYRLNTVGSMNVAAACARNAVRLIAISTDYVFKGDLNRPYHEFDVPNPQTMYGKTKYAGEEMIRRHCPDHVIARISWLYGAGGPSFVHTMLKLADGTRPKLKIVSDQIGNPTCTTAVAKQLRNLIQRPELIGTFHMTGEGEASWFEFAKEIFRLTGIKQEIQPCTTMEYPTPAPRPANSRLDKMMLRLQGLPQMPDWHDMLAEFIQQEFQGK